MNKKYNILVLTNLNDSPKTLLKNAIKPAQTLNGEIRVLHVQKPLELVSKESQLSAIRNIYDERNATDNKMREFIEPVSKEFGISIKHILTIGNVKNELSKYIDEHQPDMIILGKRKSNPLKLIGDRTSQYILNNFEGEIMIAPDKKTLEPNKEIAMGALEDKEAFFASELTKQLVEETRKPLKSFKFTKNADDQKETHVQKDNSALEYVFEHNQNALEKFPDYLVKNNIDLLLIKNERGMQGTSNLKSSDINSIIKKVDLPLLVINKRKTA